MLVRDNLDTHKHARPRAFPDSSRCSPTAANSHFAGCVDVAHPPRFTLSLSKSLNCGGRSAMPRSAPRRTTKSTGSTPRTAVRLMSESIPSLAIAPLYQCSPIHPKLSSVTVATPLLIDPRAHVGLRPSKVMLDHRESGRCRP
ncbi:hypothetical protein AQI95_40745 [Streptomyces yokosukanensis]|uniref:Uncharacterized protein n=1 Tax=Streptomyces yokosukanensis TaxID=67386 RepID=A0A101NTL3_9ACTN|nr:hypothetical protein AQI95_40745 [Streptomyces yokosukanensis]